MIISFLILFVHFLWPFYLYPLRCLHKTCPIFSSMLKHKYFYVWDVSVITYVMLLLWFILILFIPIFSNFLDYIVFFYYFIIHHFVYYNIVLELNRGNMFHSDIVYNIIIYCCLFLTLLFSLSHIFVFNMHFQIIAKSCIYLAVLPYTCSTFASILQIELSRD